MFCKVELYILRWDLSWPERLFLHFFRKLFRTRLCKDIIYYFAQKRSFLQRRKSVCKRSCTVRGMRPPQGLACVRLRLGIFAQKFEKQQKNLSFVKDLNSNKAFCVFQVCAKLFHCRSNPYRNLSFFVVFQFFLQRSYTVALRKWVPEEAASHVRYGIFCTHFFDVAKKTSSEQRCIW